MDDLFGLAPSSSSVAFSISTILIAVTAAAALISILSLRVTFKRGEGIENSALNIEERLIRKRIDEGLKDGGPSDRQFALLREYHTQGLAQSKISFWFSLLFAALGFLMILYSIVFYLGGGGALPITDGDNIVQPSATEELQKPIFALVAGTVVEAVAALFFVQSNRARELMSAFFDKARLDRKLDEALLLASQIEDTSVSAKLKAYLALSFAETEPSQEVLHLLMKDDEVVSSEVLNPN